MLGPPFDAWIILFVIAMAPAVLTLWLVARRVKRRGKPYWRTYLLGAAGLFGVVMLGFGASVGWIHSLVRACAVRLASTPHDCHLGYLINLPVFALTGIVSLGVYGVGGAVFGVLSDRRREAVE